MNNKNQYLCDIIINPSDHHLSVISSHLSEKPEKKNIYNSATYILFSLDLSFKLTVPK